jgi:hypothetical protein
MGAIYLYVSLSKLVVFNESGCSPTVKTVKQMSVKTNIKGGRDKGDSQKFIFQG